MAWTVIAMGLVASCALMFKTVNSLMFWCSSSVIPFSTPVCSLIQLLVATEEQTAAPLISNLVIACSWTQCYLLHHYIVLFATPVHSATCYTIAQSSLSITLHSIACYTTLLYTMCHNSMIKHVLPHYFVAFC